MPEPERARRRHRLLVDRVACTGHGACAAVLPDHVALDPWGYPVVSTAPVPRELLETAVQLCPRRALRGG